MKSKSGIRIKNKNKKKKKIIHIIIVEENQLSSPHNTNQYLLTKHEYQKINQEKVILPPGSMLQYLLNQEDNDKQLSHTSTYEQIKKVLEID